MKTCKQCEKPCEHTFCSSKCKRKFYFDLGRYDTQTEEVRTVNKFLLRGVKA